MSSTCVEVEDRGFGIIRVRVTPRALCWTWREKFLHERRKLQKDFWALISQAIDD